MKSMRDIWAVSLLVIGVLSVFFMINGFVDLGLPDAVTWILGILDLVAVVALVYTTVKLKLWRKDQGK